MKTALICGVTGQDGAYLAKKLLENGYRVVGTSRNAPNATFLNLRKLSIFDDVERESMLPTDLRNTLHILSKNKPDEVYNLAGQSSVALSFERPVETLEGIAIGALNLMESIRILGGGIRFFNTSSSECFGDTVRKGANEDTPFRPRSPYGVAKAASHWTVVNYRETYGLFASNGILFNHDSPLRPERFVTRKIIVAACAIQSKRQQALALGNLAICRDWGWAPQYVDAMWRIMQHSKADDFVIASGETHSLQDFAEAAFIELGLNWRDHVRQDESLTRHSDIIYSRGDPSKAKTLLGWEPKYTMRDVVRMMIKAELDKEA